MMHFNLETAAVLVGLLYLVISVLTWVVLGEGRSSAAALWCLGGLSMGVGTVMIGVFSSASSPTLSLSIPVLLYQLSFAMRAQSLRMETAHPFSVPWVALVLAVSTMVYEALLRGLGLYVPRAIYASLVFAAGAAILAHDAWRLSLAETSRSVRWIAWSYGAVASAFLLRGFYLARQDLSVVDGNVIQDGAVGIVVSLAMLLSSVVGYFGYVGLALERSQRRAIEVAKEQTRLEVSQQLGAQMAVLERRQSLGELAASMGHEIKQPLTAVLTNAQLARRGLSTGRMGSEQAVDLLQKIERNTLRASKLLERLRRYTRSADIRQEVVDLRKAVPDVLELLEGELRRQSLTVEQALTPGPVWVRGDLLQLSQVLLNILRNAIDSMQGRPLRRIALSCRQADGRAWLAVRDWGAGLSESEQEQIGSPFFSTKADGLGMGLAISRTIARDHGGVLSVSNAQDGRGPGVLAQLELPLAVPESR